MPYTKVYVIECKNPNCWYVGSTFRELYDRIDEHSSHCGSVWTRRHGFKRMAIWRDVPEGACTCLENLIDAFQVFRRLEHPDHLNTKSFADSVLSGVPDQLQHVLPSQLVPAALRAK